MKLTWDEVRVSAPRTRGVGGLQLPALAGPARVSSPQSGGRWASAPRTRGAGEGQLPAFGGSVSVSFPHSQVRRVSASRSRGVGEDQLPAFGESVRISFPHSGGRRVSASRIRKAGERQLPAFGVSVRISFPHSGGRWGSASRIRVAGGGQLPAFGGPEGVSFPHSGGPVKDQLPAFPGLGNRSAGRIRVNSEAVSFPRFEDGHRGSASRIRGVGQGQKPACLGDGGGQRPAFLRSRAGQLPAFVGSERVQLPAFGRVRSSRRSRFPHPRRPVRISFQHSGGRSRVSFPHSKGRRGSSSRIRTVGEAQRGAFAGPRSWYLAAFPQYRAVGDRVSFPRSSSRAEDGSLPAFGGFGEGRRPGFARPASVSFPPEVRFPSGYPLNARAGVRRRGAASPGWGIGNSWGMHRRTRRPPLLP